jgi:hypothetical protein
MCITLPFVWFQKVFHIFGGEINVFLHLILWYIFIEIGRGELHGKIQQNMG